MILQVARCHSENRRVNLAAAFSLHWMLVNHVSAVPDMARAGKMAAGYIWRYFRNNPNKRLKKIPNKHSLETYVLSIGIDSKIYECHHHWPPL
jgi:hypothetical protein